MANRGCYCSVPQGIWGRRDFIKIGALGAFGLSMGDYFSLRAAANPHSPAGETSHPTCILIWCGGGPSHIDTWDPKPDAPAEIRGTFKAIPTNVAEIRISERLPRSAKQTDKYAIIRSVYGQENSHEKAIPHVLTGYRPLKSLEFPSLGSVVAKEKGERNNLPPYVVIPHSFAASGYGPGFLDGIYAPFVAGDPSLPNYRLRDIDLPVDVNWDRVSSRRWLLDQMDQIFRKHDQQNELKTLDAFYEKAYALISSPTTKKAFDIAAEPDNVRNLYGRTPMGQGCLLARRLVEAGVSFVTISKGRDNWDTHVANFDTLEKLLPELDMAFSALLEDLHQRGLLKTTLVVVMGEMGRTPTVNPKAGRDHWIKSWSVVMAGAGIRGGQVYGATDDYGAEIKDKPVKVPDITATIYSRLGIDPKREYPTPIGRPIHLSDGGEPLPLS